MGKSKKLICLANLLLLITALIHPQERPKIGLVLSGGGAKGVAHIPVLKLLDELDFPVDCIAGTSAGGIMGGLYAFGYSGADIERIFNRLDWEDFISDRPPRDLAPFFEKRLDGRYQVELPLRKGLPSTPRGLIAGQKFYNLFSSLFFPLPSDIEFDSLPIPFRCLAVDIIRAQQVVLEKGSLARALRATMSIPTIFAPVEWGEYLLVDGGLLNNLPVDVVADMKADIIIAVDLANPLTPREELSTAEKILGQSLQAIDLEQKTAKLEKVDLLIWPDMNGLSSTDYFFPDKMARIRERGEEAARKARPALLALKEKYGLSRSSKECAVERSGGAQKCVLGQVVFAGNKMIPSSFIARLFELKTDDVVDASRITRRLNELYALRYFENIQYEVLPGEEGKIDLLLSLRELPRGNFRAGLRYDNFHKLVAAAGFYATNFPFAGLRLENEVEAAGLTRILSKVSYPTKTLNFPVYPLAYAQYQDIPSRLYGGDGGTVSTYQNRSFSFGIGLGFLFKKSLNLELSYELERMNIEAQAEWTPQRSVSGLHPTLKKIRLSGTLDTLDSLRDPRYGLLLRGLYEGSFESLGSEAPYELAETSFETYFTLGGRNTFRLHGYWGTSNGDIPFYKYLNRGRPASFVGMGYDQLQGNAMKILRADYIFRYSRLVQFKLMANVALGMKQTWPDTTYSPDILWGVGTGIAIHTPLGVLEFIYGLGSKGFSDANALQNVVYLQVGARF